MAKLTYKQIYWDWRAFKISLIFFSLFSFILLFIPLFNSLGYEFSFLLSVIASFFAGYIGISYLERVRNQFAPFPGAQRPMLKLFLKIFIINLFLTLIPFLFIFIRQLITGFCNLFQDLLFFILITICSVAYSSFAGLFFGTLRPYILAHILWVICWILSFIWIGYLFYSTPSVEFVGTFFGYFAGPIYDENISVPLKLITFRMLNLFEILIMLSIIGKLTKPDTIYFSIKAAWSNKRYVLAGIVLLSALEILSFTQRTKLNWMFTSKDIASNLGGRIQTEHFVIYYSDQIEPEKIELFKKDAEFSYNQITNLWKVKNIDKRITIFLFDSPQQKDKFMGASYTYIAKPWRVELYLHSVQFPHPTLRHELAHVISGFFAPTPFKTPGSLRGLIPYPALVEGAPVAVDFDYEEYNPHEWSRALLDIKKLPSIDDLMGTGFFLSYSRLSYTVSGSFIRFLIDYYGIENFKKLYMSGDFLYSYDKTPEQLEQHWHRFLRKVNVSKDIDELAKMQFERPSVFYKVCPHEMSRLQDEIEKNWERNRYNTSIDIIKKLINIEPSVDSNLLLIQKLMESKQCVIAKKNLDIIKSDVSTTMEKINYFHINGDLEWLEGRRKTAQLDYETMLNYALPSDLKRLIKVSIYGVKNDIAEPYLRKYLLSNYLKINTSLSLLLLREYIDVNKNDPIGYYLIGRRLFLGQEYEHAVKYLAEANKLSLPEEDFSIENNRMLGICYYVLEDYNNSSSAFNNILKIDKIPLGLKENIEDWIKRVEWSKSYKNKRI